MGVTKKALSVVDPTIAGKQHGQKVKRKLGKAWDLMLAKPKRETMASALGGWSR